MSDIGQSHFLGGSPLNRLSWLRNSPVFLTTALESPKTKWLIFNDGNPLSRISTDPVSKKDSPSLLQVPTKQVLPLLGPAPYFAQGQHPGDTLPLELQTTEHNGAGKFLEAARIHGPPIVFLGTRETDEEALLPSIDFKNPESSDDIKGEPYFTLDVTDLDPELLKQTFQLTSPGEAVRIEFAEPRAAGLNYNLVEASLFSLARTSLDWNARNKFCTACGSKIYSLWGGWKLSCSTLLPWADNTGRTPCPTAKGLHNTMHPRVDAVVITAVLDETGDRILLGRNKRFPPGFYSTLAGFLEPNESFEEAVAREIWEESGVRVTNVRYHSCQPWPFPANLMVGCFALADSSQKIRTDLDNELEDARWFTREEVLEILGQVSGTNFSKEELRKMGEDDPAKKVLAPAVNSSDRKKEENDVLSDEDGPEKRKKKPVYRVPGKTAIAGVLISKFANRELDGLNFTFSAKSKI